MTGSTTTSSINKRLDSKRWLNMSGHGTQRRLLKSPASLNAQFGGRQNGGARRNPVSCSMRGALNTTVMACRTASARSIWSWLQDELDEKDAATQQSPARPTARVAESMDRNATSYPERAISATLNTGPTLRASGVSIPMSCLRPE